VTNDFFRLIIIFLVVSALLLGLGIAALSFLAYKAGLASRARRSVKAVNQIPGWVPANPEHSSLPPASSRSVAAKEVNLPFVVAVLFFAVLIILGFVVHSVLPLLLGALATLICHAKIDRLKSINFALVALFESFGILLAWSIAWRTLNPIFLIGILTLFYRKGKSQPERIPPAR
jgi:phosphotransferase system  glucose/maltose/N-acetylglucosamine-specific IIC component